MEAGIFRLKEYVGGYVDHTKVPRARVPAYSYYKSQIRFGQLFERVRNDAHIAAIQASVDAYWQTVA